jgi:hypothetical protein
MVGAKIVLPGMHPDAECLLDLIEASTSPCLSLFHRLARCAAALSSIPAGGTPTAMSTVCGGTAPRVDDPCLDTRAP